ncbi:MAG: exonuclease SbcCD subunit D [Desulfocucumaceae bacterium]
MKILHTSDWHLGRIFHGLHLTEDQAYTLDQFVRLVGEERPEAVLIAGDIYDRSVPPTEAVKLLDEVLSRILIDYRVPVILISGNHDSPERLGFGTRLLARQGLHITGQLEKRPAPVEIYDKYGPVYIYPVPYSDPPIARERLEIQDIHDHDRAMASIISQLDRQIPPGARSVLVTHAFVAGGVESESERPLSIGGAGTVRSSHFSSFSYVALGHLHRPQCTGGEHIRYSGSLMKYSFSEADHRKAVTIVEIDGSGKTAAREISLSPRRDVRCLEGYLDEILAGPRSREGREDYLRVTLKDSGAILDAMGKLRQVYPNVLHIERPFLSPAGKLKGPGGDHLKLSEADLFASFFDQVAGVPLSAEQSDFFAGTVERLYRQEREVR